jgi:hypothetical protein
VEGGWGVKVVLKRIDLRDWKVSEWVSEFELVVSSKELSILPRGYDLRGGDMRCDDADSFHRTGIVSVVS